MTVLSPGTLGELGQLFPLALEAAGPVYFRLGRKTGPALEEPILGFESGEPRYREGRHVNIVCSGPILEDAIFATAELAGESIEARVMNGPVLPPIQAPPAPDSLADDPVIAIFWG